MQLKMERPKNDFNQKTLENMMMKENDFITNLFSMVPFPKRCEDGDEDDEEDDEVEHKEKKLPELKGEKKTRAVTIEDLQKRLEGIHSKPKLSYKDKLQKKGLKNRMKKKSKREERNVKQKILRAEKMCAKEIIKSDIVKTEEAKPAKPVFNSDGNMVFSKFDFTGLGQNKRDKKQEKDPKKILQNLQRQKEKLQRLEAEGEKEKVVELKEKTAWRAAIAKAEGEKVKDDPELLKKSVKKKEQRVKQSKKKWDKRIENVKKQQEERQKKRADNIQKKKKERKVNKMKKAVKRGKVIPGF